MRRVWTKYDNNGQRLKTTSCPESVSTTDGTGLMYPSQRDVACPAMTLGHFWWRWVVHPHLVPSCPSPSATLRPFPQATSPLGYSAFLDSLLLTSPPPRSFSLPCFTFSFLGRFPHLPLHLCPSGTPLVLSHRSTPIAMLRGGGWGFHQKHWSWRAI